VQRSYLTRILRLTLLAPDIVEAILEGRQGSGVTLARLRAPVPEEWERQGTLYDTPEVLQRIRPPKPR
jgi:hypothetical protein